VDDRLKQLLKELGEAINGSISGSEEVNWHIQRIRDEGYNLYVFLDATIGLNREGDAETRETIERHEISSTGNALVRRDAAPPETTEVQFRIDMNDLNFLRTLGIDPTRKVKRQKRLEPASDVDEQQSA
jgi:hypothetical protein